MKSVMYEKAQQAQLCYEDLKEKTGENPALFVTFRVDPRQKGLMKGACMARNPFPIMKRSMLTSLRKKAVKKLYRKEKVLQTGPLAAILAFDAAVVQEFGLLRNAGSALYSMSASDNSSVSGTPAVNAPKEEVICDVGFAGLQAFRLFMTSYRGSREFAECRYQSAVRMNHALNGSLCKYRTADRRIFSSYVYDEARLKCMLQLLGLHKDPDKFTSASMTADKIVIAGAVRRRTAAELEAESFEKGLCGCMVRAREEWETSEAGEKVHDMPLYIIKKESGGLNKAFGKMDVNRGPLSGIKVLDLTRLIAGPTAARMLAEYGADVLMVRCGSFSEQELAMQELDGWAGRKRISLNLNDPNQLAKVTELIQGADVIISSRQDAALEHCGLSPADIHRINPNAIYAAESCFPDGEWKQKDCCASCAEDITGLSVRNGSFKKPVNLNGIPLEYISGMILFAGIMKALKLQITEGGSYTVNGSLIRTAEWLHECTDIWEQVKDNPQEALRHTDTIVRDDLKVGLWKKVYHKVPWTAVGDVFYPAPATWSEGQDYLLKNMRFTEEERGFRL